MCAPLWLHPCLVLYGSVTLWTCGSPNGTQHDGPGSVCCLCIALGVVQTGVGHVHTVAMSGPGVLQGSMMSRQSWEQWFCEVVCVCVAIAVVGPTSGTPDGRGGLGGGGYDSVAFLWVFVSLR